MRGCKCLRIFGFVTLLLFLSTLAASSSSVAVDKAEDEFVPVNTDSVPVLNYHMVGDLNEPLCISPQDFEDQMRYLADNGFTTITPDQLMDHLEHGDQLPEKPVMITFDDGYSDNYHIAYPILRKYGHKAVFFLIAEYINNDSRFMNWQQVREMSKNGMIMQSHTVRHVNLTKLAPDEAYREMVEAKQIIEQEVGKPVRYLAYPTGAVDKSVAQLTQKAGYHGAFSTRFGEAGVDSNRYAIERIPILGSAKTFRSFFFRLNAAPVLERFGIIRQ